MKKTPLVRKTPLRRKTPLKTSQSHARAKKPRPKKNADLYAKWNREHRHCQVCGIDGQLAARMRFPGLSTHHICKAGRVHHPANLIRLCQRCHDLAEGLNTPVWLPVGVKWYYPKLRLANIIWAKREHDPAGWDEGVLRKLNMKPLPEPEQLAEVFRAEWAARVDSDVDAAAAILEKSNFPGDLWQLLGARMQPRPAAWKGKPPGEGQAAA